MAQVFGYSANAQSTDDASPCEQVAASHYASHICTAMTTCGDGSVLQCQALVTDQTTYCGSPGYCASVDHKSVHCEYPNHYYRFDKSCPS